MKTPMQILVLALALGALAACGKKEEEKPKPVEVVVTLPANPADSQAWKIYLSSVVKKNMEGIRSSPYMYYLPDAASTPDFEEQYTRQLDNVMGVVGRGVLPGNMLAFGSPESQRMADLMVESFTGIDAGSMKDVRVLFIGKPEDAERVKVAVEPSGAIFVFHEAK